MVRARSYYKNRIDKFRFFLKNKKDQTKLNSLDDNEMISDKSSQSSFELWPSVTDSPGRYQQASYQDIRLTAIITSAGIYIPH
jgi:hypothetical protein